MSRFNDFDNDVVTVHIVNILKEQDWNSKEGITLVKKVPKNCSRSIRELKKTFSNQDKYLIKKFPKLKITYKYDN